MLCKCLRRNALRALGPESVPVWRFKPPNRLIWNTFHYISRSMSGNVGGRVPGSSFLINNSLDRANFSPSKGFFYLLKAFFTLGPEGEGFFHFPGGFFPHFRYCLSSFPSLTLTLAFSSLNILIFMSGSTELRGLDLKSGYLGGVGY